MKKIVPFRKEIDFKTNISEITSISLEHTVAIENNEVVGEFLINGDYKMADTSTNTEDFNYNIPFEIELDEKYLLDKATVDIDDFYYEIINDRLLVLNIDVAIDHLEEKPLPPLDSKEDTREIKQEPINKKFIEIEEIEEVPQQIIQEESLVENILSQRCIEEETISPILIEEKVEPVATERKNTVNIFDNFDNNENYLTYSICIIREGDTIESIIEKYSISKEELEEYNNLSDLKIGMKLIIPSK